MRSYVPDATDLGRRFDEPLFDNLWDCFRDENLKRVEAMLKGEAQGVTARYEQIRFELQEVSMESPEHYNQNWSKGLLIFMQSQAVIKLVR